MLTASQFDALMTGIEDLFGDFIDSIIIDIARRFAKTGRVTATAAWQMQRIHETGAAYEATLDELAKILGLSDELLAQLFEAAGVETLAFDDMIYQAAGLNPLPIQLSHPMQEALLAGLRKTMGQIHNLTMTTAMAGQNLLTDALDLAYMQVSSGAMDYDSAIRAGVKNLVKEGLATIEYGGGRREQVDVVVRRAVLTGVAQTTGELQKERIKEMGVSLIATSAHIGARPTHEVWQGKVFSVVGSTAEYPNFQESTHYGEVDGLCGINCRHSFYPFYEGISEPAYSQATLDEYADATVEYNGHEMSVYDATQKQRSFERQIRAAKREANALEAAGMSNEEEVMKVRHLQAGLRDFIDQTGLDRQSVREGGRVKLILGGA